MKFLFPLLVLTLFFEVAFSQVVKLNKTQSFQFVEGPVWDGKGVLYFSDMNAKKVYKYIPAKGTAGFSVIRNGQVTNGMAFDSSGSLLVCEQGPTNEVVRMDTTGIVTEIIANRFNGKPFNNPNDLCKDKNGGIYFTDPTWAGLPQDKHPVYYIKPTGEVILINGDFLKPNGICLSLDGKLLYVDDSNDKNVFVFDVQPDGTAINKRVFCVLKVNTGQVSSADGMKIDSEGSLYIATAVGIQVFNSSGVAQKIINIPETPTNVAFGGKDLKTLYITAGTSLYSIQVDIPGKSLTAVSEIKAGNFSVFPNPTTGILHIGLAEYNSLKVYNTSGQEVLTKNAVSASNIIDLSSLQNGCYLFKIEAGKEICSSKVILQK